MPETLEELIDRFVGLEEVSIFCESDFVEDVFEIDKIPQHWLDKEVEDWTYSAFSNLLIVTIE